jgi:hypothetical protein
MAAGATYEPIATFTVSTAQASYTFSGISGSYTDLVLVVTGTASSGSYFTLRFNSDTGSNYSNTEMDGYSGGAASNRNTSSSYMYNGSIQTTQTNTISHIQNYSNSTTNKTVLTRSNYATSGVKASVGLWRNTAAITSIEIGTGGANTYQSGATFTLYGIAAA